MKPTEQQVACIVAGKAYPIVKIEAGAGSGKTSTLKLVSEAIPEPSLYVAFNKVTALEAEAKFPQHVLCKTTHSVAYAMFGKHLQDKLSRPKGGYVNVAFTGTEIARFYKLGCITDPTGHIAVTDNGIGLFVRQTVERFEQSADMEISDKHLPLFDMARAIDADITSKSYVLKHAKKLWADRINPASKVMASHDTYLKMYQLSKPVLSQKVIYLDEAQDSTPCVLDIIMNQAKYGAKIILVGDRYQAIYGWRGAINAMERVDGHTTLLSKSFRFGQGVADVATAVLQGQLKLTGREDLKSTVGGGGTVDRTKPYMYLFRSNSALLYAAVKAIQNGEEIRLEIDVKDFVRLLQSANALSRADMKNVKHENILPYPTWGEYKEEAQKMTGEMKRIVNIIEGGDFYRFVSTLEGYENPPSANVIYTSAHKSKGREHDQVILADDFPSHYDGGDWEGLPPMEQNLLYVAVTRSMRVLEINDSVREAIDYYNNHEGEEDFATKEHQRNQLDSIIRDIGNSNGMSMNGEMAIEAMHREMELDDGALF